MDMSNVISQMLILFLMMLIGYIANKVKVLDEQSNKVLSRVVVFLTNPALILSSIVNSDLDISKGETFRLILIALLFYMIMPLMAKFFCLFVKGDSSVKHQYEAMLTFTNLGFMGIPVISALYGAGAIFYVTIFLLPFNILIYSYGIYLLATGEGEHSFSWKKVLNPSVIMALIVLVIFFLDIQTPYVINETSSLVGATTTPLAMIIIGSNIALTPLKDVFLDVKVYVFGVVKLLVVPFIILGIFRNFISNDVLLGVIVIIAGMPVASNVAILRNEYGDDSVLISKGTMITTLFSLVTIPVLALLL